MPRYRPYGQTRAVCPYYLRDSRLKISCVPVTEQAACCAVEFDSEQEKRRYMRVQQLERENARYQRQQAELAQRRQMDQAYQRLMQEADGVKAQYPAFDLNAEMQDPDFVRLLRAQVPLKTIYEVRHQDEILGGAMQYTAQKVAAKVAAGVSANRGRPAENGAAASGASGARFDVEHSTKEQRMALIRRAANGERIEF